MNAHVPAPDLSQYQVECWAALGRLLAPFLPPEPVAAAVAPAVEDVLPVPVAELSQEALAVMRWAGEELPPAAVLTTAPTEPPAPDPGFNPEDWLPARTGLTPELPVAPVHDMEPIDRVQQAAGEFFTSLAWGTVGAVPGAPADATVAAPPPPSSTAAEFFGHGVAWGHGPGLPVDAPDPLNGRMFAAATQSALHLSRKLARNPANAGPADSAGDFFTGLDWQPAVSAPAVAA